MHSNISCTNEDLRHIYHGWNGWERYEVTVIKLVAGNTVQRQRWQHAERLTMDNSWYRLLCPFCQIWTSTATKTFNDFAPQHCLCYLCCFLRFPQGLSTYTAYSNKLDDLTSQGSRAARDTHPSTFVSIEKRMLSGMRANAKWKSENGIGW